MKKNLLRQITTSKYRYWFGVGALVIFGLLVAGYKFWSLPNGLSSAEIAAATEAGHLSPLGLFKEFSDSLSHLINLPWNLLEWLSFKVFGFTEFAMRLPALILMLFAAGALMLTIWKWSSKASAAISSGFIMTTSVMFLSLARTGTATAVAIFLISFIILLVTLLVADELAGWRKIVAQALLCVAAALLIYTPGGLYIVGVLMIIAAVHPKSRLLFLKIKPWKLLIGVVVGLMVLAPLIVGVILRFKNNDLSLLKELLVLNHAWLWPNLQTLASAFVGVFGGWTSEIVLPMISVVELVIIILGLAALGKDITSARSYSVLALLIVSLVLAALNPDLIYLLFVPLMLAAGVGLATLMRSWYRLFPLNPYARTLGLVLLGVLIIGVCWSNIGRYYVSQNYDKNVVYNYDQEFTAVRAILSERKGNAMTLVVPADQQRFYEILTHDFDKTKVATTADSNAKDIIVLDSSGVKIDGLPQQIVTSWRAQSSVLLRIY